MLDLIAHRFIEQVPEEEVPMRSVTVSNDGATLVGGNNKGNCYIWNIQNTRDFTDLQPKTKFQAHQRYLIRCLLSPNGRLGSFSFSFFFKPTTRCIFADLTSSRTLATCSADTTIRLWDLSSSLHAPTKILQGHQRWVWDMAFSADSAYLVSGASDLLFTIHC
jgi:G protein beta subunit-like protein